MLGEDTKMMAYDIARLHLGHISCEHVAYLQPYDVKRHSISPTLLVGNRQGTKVLHKGGGWHVS